MRRKKMAQPQTAKGTLIGVRLSPEELAALDERRRAEPDLPGRPEMVRRLIRSPAKGKR